MSCTRVYQDEGQCSSLSIPWLSAPFQTLPCSLNTSSGSIVQWVNLLNVPFPSLFPPLYTYHPSLADTCNRLCRYRRLHKDTGPRGGQAEHHLQCHLPGIVSASCISASSCLPAESITLTHIMPVDTSHCHIAAPQSYASSVTNQSTDGPRPGRTAPLVCMLACLCQGPHPPVLVNLPQRPHPHLCQCPHTHTPLLASPSASSRTWSRGRSPTRPASGGSPRRQSSTTSCWPISPPSSL